MVSQSRIILGFISVCLIWGSTWAVIKIGVQDIPPILAASIRLFLSSAFLFIIIQFKKIKIHWTKENRKLFLVIALSAFTIPFALLYWGSKFVPSGLTSLLFAIFPFAVVVFSFFMLKNEEITLFKILGIIVGFFGLYFIFSGDINLNNSNSKTLFGMIGIIFSAILNAYNVVYTKKYGHDISPFVLTFVPMLYSAVLLLITSFYIESYQQIIFTSKAIYSILYLSIFGSIIGFVTYYWLLKHLQTAIISFTAFITPIIAIILGYFLFDEKLSTNLFIGISSVLVGLIFANIDELKKLRGKKLFQ